MSLASIEATVGAVVSDLGPAGAVVGALGSLIAPGQSAGAITNENENSQLYQLAIGGDSLALANLATASGQAGQALGIPGAGVPSPTSPAFAAIAAQTDSGSIGATIAGGWGSANAQADAANKYQQAVAYLNSHGGGSILSGTTGEILLFGGLGLGLILLILLVR